MADQDFFDRLALLRGHLFEKVDVVAGSVVPHFERHHHALEEAIDAVGIGGIGVGGHWIFLPELTASRLPCRANNDFAARYNCMKFPVPYQEKIMQLRSCRRFVALVVVAFIGVDTSMARGQDLTPEARRERFLKLVDRPKVDPEPKITETSENGGFTQYRFEYSSEADQRVPAIALLKTSFTEDGKQHPCAVVLHGTGGKKE